MPINREVLTWARKRASLSQEEAAEKAHVKTDQIQRWEDGKAVPTVKQARKLADIYDRPFLEFLGKELPPVREPAMVPDFRMHRGIDLPQEQYVLLQVRAEAEETRLNALDLFELIGESPPRLPDSLYASLDDDAEDAARRAREIVGPSIQAQTSLKAADRDGFTKVLRSSFERAGILVTKNATLATLAARGMCLFDPLLPVIVFSNEAPGAQAFTLAHELGHVALKQSALSGAPGAAAPSAKRIEDWCDEFAGAFLVPDNALAQLANKPDRPSSSISDAALSALANRFAISRHAMLIRLVNLGYVQASYYWQVKRPQFIEEESNFSSFGRPKYYGSRYRSSRGDLYTGLVIDAWSNGAITNHNAAEFMGIGNIKHLEDIRDHFVS